MMEGWNAQVKWWCRGGGINSECTVAKYISLKSMRINVDGRTKKEPTDRVLRRRGGIQICPGRTGRSGKGNFRDPLLVEKKRKNASGIRKARKARANRKNSRQHLHAHSTYLRRLLHLSRLLWTSLLTLVVVGCTCAWCHHHNPSSLLESLLLVEFFFFFLVSLVVAGVIIIRK